ncbi:MAG: phosphoribosylanthranilate isomerase [Oscillospiraceae bacterium]|nr:phosphoribosylanthranilate isomerase [Oscillospiraceae bacterium]
MTKMKICGLMRVQDAQYANAVQPDFAGMILSAGFRRSVTAETAQAIRDALNPDIPVAGVFVDENIEAITAFLQRGTIQAVQLHGHEDAQYIAALRQVTDAMILQAFRIRSAEDVQLAQHSAADMILLDSGTGTGQVFDWSLLSGITRPFFLAGGLHPENVAEAIRTVRPSGVDVSSGVETDGQKDPQKIRAFADAVRQS